MRIILGKTFTSVKLDGTALIFENAEEKYRFFEESLFARVVEGDLKYLEGSPLLNSTQAKKMGVYTVDNLDYFNEGNKPKRASRFATIKGVTTVYWHS